MTDPIGQYQTVLDAISSLDARFTTALNTGLASLNTAILTLTEAHHRALLEQERRNGQFATQRQVEQIISRLDAHTGSGARRDEQIKSLRDVLSTTALHHDEQIASIERRIADDDNHAFSLSTTLTGYLVSALITGLAVTFAFVLAHLSGIH